MSTRNPNKARQGFVYNRCLIICAHYTLQCVPLDLIISVSFTSPESDWPWREENWRTSVMWRSSYNNSWLYFCNLRSIFHQVLHDVSSNDILQVIQTNVEKSQELNFPSLFFPNFSVDNYAKIRGKRSSDQWEGSLSMFPNKQREEGYVLAGWLSPLNIHQDSASDFRTNIQLPLIFQQRGWQHHLLSSAHFVLQVGWIRNV